MPTRHLQKHFRWILCLPSVHAPTKAEEEVTAVVSAAAACAGLDLQQMMLLKSRRYVDVYVDVYVYVYVYLFLFVEC